jgi:hypothetical protein
MVGGRFQHDQSYIPLPPKKTSSFKSF